jgi:hypothetical protein
MPSKTHKLTIGKAGAILEALNALSHPQFAPQIHMSTRPAREIFEARKKEIENGSGSNGAIETDKQRQLEEAGELLSKEEVDVELATIKLDEIKGEGDGRLATVFSIIDGYVIDEPTDEATQPK